MLICGLCTFSFATVLMVLTIPWPLHKIHEGLWRHLNFCGPLEILRFPIWNLIRGLEGKGTKISAGKVVLNWWWNGKGLVKASSLGAVPSSQQKWSRLVKFDLYPLSNQLTPVWFLPKLFSKKQICTMKRVINYYMRSDPSRNLHIAFY